MAGSDTTQVLVVGGGPTGLLASILLSKLAVHHILVERRGETLRAPAAHVVNTRTMEIYRQAGLDVDELYALNTHPRARNITWKGRLQDNAIGVFDAGANRDALMAQSKFSDQHTTNISQHRLEAYLKRQAEISEYANIRFGCEWLGFHGEDKQSSRVRETGGDENIIDYRFLLAADGAGSSVARALQIKKVGPDALATFLNLTCEVDLAAASGDDESLLCWLLDPEVQGTIIVHDPHALSVYMRPLAVPYESIDDYDDARCERLLKAVFGHQPYKIRHKGIWQMTAQVADRFRDGSVFLAGDAIHRFPPTGGLGLNTGVGDVHNLVWKLAVALQDELESDEIADLLDSYELERRPVAQRNCDVSKRNNDKMIEVIRAVGLDPSKARQLHKVMNSTIVSALPQALQDMVFAALVRPVRSILARAQADDAEGEEIRRRVAQAIDNQQEHFSSLGLDLGYVYHQGCAVADNADETEGSEVSTYHETLGAGARLPQRSIADSEVAGSVHELLDYVGFTLLTAGANGPPGNETFGLACKEIDIGALTTVEGESVASAIGMAEGSWALVRPDGHVMAVGG